MTLNEHVSVPTNVELHERHEDEYPSSKFELFVQIHFPDESTLPVEHVIQLGPCSYTAGIEHVTH